MIRNLLLFILSAIVLTANAQTASDAKSITAIKKSRQYIYAEVTDASEEEAYKAAKADLDAQIDKYIVDSGMLEDAKAVVVSNIGTMTNKITVLRGDMHRVFVYVKKSDITASRSGVDIVNIERETDTTTVEPVVESAATEPVVTEPVVATEPAKTVSPTPTTVQPSAGYFSGITGVRATTLATIAKATDMSGAEEILSEQYLLKNVKGYGSMGDCRSVTQSYWVVSGADGVTILSPVRDGQRWNYKTGRTDSLDNYVQKLWFRL